MKESSKANTFALFRELRQEQEWSGKSAGTLRLLRRVFTYARPYARKRNALVCLVVMRSCLLPLLAWAIGATINGPVERANFPGIALATAGFAALAAFTQFAFHYRMRLALELGEAVIHDLREALFRHLHRLNLAFFDRTKAGRMISHMTSDLDSIRIGVQDFVFISVVQAGQMLVSAILMAWYDWVLFLMVLAMGPMIWKLNRFFTSKILGKQRKAQASYSRITSVLAESVSGIRVTQGFVRQEVNAGFFRELVSDHSRYNLDAGQTSAIFLPLLELNSQFFVALLVVVGGYRAINPEIHRPVGDIIQFFFLSNLFFDPIRTLSTQYSNALTAMVGAERVFRFLDLQPDWHDPEDAREIGPLRGSVEFRDVCFAYEKDGPLILKHINFVAQPGQTVALVGHTGSGKTSITNLIARMYLPVSGRIEVDGRDLLGIRSESLHRQMGIVPQESFLFEGTVLDNIRLARPEADVQEAFEILRKLDCLDIIESLPDGMYTEVGERGSRLSVGQRQVISFARAMMVDPRILILDEATSAIDAITELKLQRALQVMLSGRISFVVAHRLSTIRSADLILVLQNGEIVERGTHSTLLDLDGVYAGLHRHFAHPQ